MQNYIIFFYKQFACKKKFIYNEKSNLTKEELVKFIEDFRKKFVNNIDNYLFNSFSNISISFFTVFGSIESFQFSSKISLNSCGAFSCIYSSLFI